MRTDVKYRRELMLGRTVKRYTRQDHCQCGGYGIGGNQNVFFSRTEDREKSERKGGEIRHGVARSGCFWIEVLASVRFVL